MKNSKVSALQCRLANYLEAKLIFPNERKWQDFCSNNLTLNIMVPMDLNSFESLIKSENACRLFFVRSCWKNYRRFCIRCRGYKIYRIVGKRYRCKRCGYTFHDFSGRWINNLRISCKQWVWIIKLFELELSGRKISEQIGLSYPTVLKALHVIRLSILANSVSEDELLKWGVGLDERHLEVLVFGIRERNGVVEVEVVKDMKAEMVLDLTVKTVKRGSIVYTDKFKKFDSLMFCGYRHLKIDRKKKFDTGRVYINGVEGFWSYARKRLIKHHGVSREKFPFYLKEMEFRYNNRYRPIFSILANYLVDFMPDRL